MREAFDVKEGSAQEGQKKSQRLASAPADAAHTTPPMGSRISRWIALLLQAVALAVPVFYAAGRIYNDAYWQQMGLSASLMDTSTPDFLYSGFVALVNGLAHYVGLDVYSTIGWVLSVAVVLGVILAIAYLLGHYLGPWLRHLAQKADGAIQQFRDFSKHQIANKLLSIFSVISSIVLVALVLLWFCFVLFLFVALPTQEGKRQADRTHERYRNPQTADATKRPPPPRVLLSTRRQPIDLLECSSRWCVIFESDRFGAVPASVVTRIDQQPPGEPLDARARPD